MYIVSGEFSQYHEQQVEELSRQYQTSLWQQDQFSKQVRSLRNRISSWFDREVDSISGIDSRLEPQPVRVKHS